MASFQRSLPQTALGVGKISVDHSATCSVVVMVVSGEL